MRVGFNPYKDRVLEKSEYWHQVIVPVYIPHQNGYFKDALRILELCLNSIFSTSHSNTFVSVVDNGSCYEVAKILRELKLGGKIHEIIETTSIGKLNAVFKALSGHNFELVTISDSDVLFIEGWQDATYEVFANFSEAGAVSPVPSSKMYGYFTENILMKYFFSNKLRFSNVQDPIAMKSFAVSIGNRDFYNDVHLNKYLTLENNNFKAVVGAGHFVCTYRGEVFTDRSENFSNYKLGGNSEEMFLDKVVIDKNLWRLSTLNNYAFHLGNVLENWMLNSELICSKEKANTKKIDLVQVKNARRNIFLPLFRRFVLGKKFKNYFLKYKGLTHNQALNY